MHPIENIMKCSVEQIKNMVDVNTIVGTPRMTAGETMVVPVSKVSLGFMSGGGEYMAKTPIKKSGGELDNSGEYPFAGAAAAGMCLTPIAFLAVNNGEVKVIPAQYDCVLQRVVEMIPEYITGIKGFVNNMCEQKNAEKESAGCSDAE